MRTEKKTKINQLINNWPRGTVMTQIYLTGKGYNSNLMRRYRLGQWVRSIGSGAYAIFDDKIDWQGGLYALQQQLNLDVHVGGRSAVELLGGAHYMHFDQGAVHLYAQPKTVLPKWFLQSEWNRQILLQKTNSLPFAMSDSFTTMKHRDFTIRISSLERAILELLVLVPEKQGFDEAVKIMDNMMNLRPRLLQKMLEKCNSIKVKRLFLYMAEKNNMSWIEHIHLNRISLGTGKRRIVKNGVLDKKYLITVPRGESDNG
ncbi:type IV toxin-antitoxin system AbiEi family antitoxin domain-containing protein [bacterium]